MKYILNALLGIAALYFILKAHKEKNSITKIEYLTEACLALLIIIMGG